MVDLAIACVGLVAGLLIGLTSIGGVLVLPALVLLLGLSPHEAIPATMVAFIAPAVVGFLAVLRQGRLDLRAAGTLWAGAIPGALAGAALLPFVPVVALLWAIAAMLAISAARVFHRPPVAADTGVRPAPTLLALSGLAVGAVSALTGTGGPVTLMPILAWRGVHPGRAVPLCQAIALPIAIFASVGYAVGFDPDWRLVGVLSGSTATGVALGVLAASRIAAGALARLIGAMMAISAALIAGRLLSG
jgi:uncharacterized membrane protein YfcA